MNEVIQLSASDYSSVFEKSLATKLLLATDAPFYTILDVNSAYLEATNSDRDTLIGKSVFMVFPANPTDEDSKNIERTIFSFEEAIRTKQQHTMYNYRYDIPIRGTDKFEERYWTTTNTPVLNEAGRVRFLIHSPVNVTDQIKDKIKQEESEAKFRVMADSMPQQVWTADADGVLDYVNERARLYFGRIEEDVIGAGWQEFIHPDDLPVCLKNWNKSLQTKELYQVEFRLRRADGQYRWHLARALPFKVKDALIKWLGTNTDIEDHKKLEYQKDEFISIASHELKTPLTSLKAYLQLLERSSVKFGVPDKFVHNSLQQLKRLEKLVNDLLDVSKISAGKMSYNMSIFNMNELIAEVVEGVQLFNSKHKIKIEKNVSVKFEGDRYRLEQVLTNFLTNAVKYSPNADKIIVRSFIQNDNLIISVQDFGIGIEKENLDKLFERFYRVNSTSMNYEGLGLGLYVSAEILKRHNGNFWIESEPGEGSTFYCRLPLSFA